VTAASLAFLYGFVASFLLWRLRRRARHRPGELPVLIVLGWVTVGLSFALAAGLTLWLLGAR
jgi:hypothetical protein